MTRIAHQRVVPMLLVVALTFSACASRQAQLEDIALSVGELALQVDHAERVAYESGLYSAARHKTLGVIVLRILVAAQAFERAALTGHDGRIERQEVIAALDAAAKASIDIPPLSAAIFAVQRFLGGA